MERETLKRRRGDFRRSEYVEAGTCQLLDRPSDSQALYRQYGCDDALTFTAGRNGKPQRRNGSWILLGAGVRGTRVRLMLLRPRAGRSGERTWSDRFGTRVCRVQLQRNREPCSRFAASRQLSMMQRKGSRNACRSSPAGSCSCGCAGGHRYPKGSRRDN